MTDPTPLYLTLPDVIMNTRLELEGIGPQATETRLAKLRRETLIAAKNGRPASSAADHAYILSLGREHVFN
jgi:hypothetical protein